MWRRVGQWLVVFGTWIECLFEDHKLVRRLLVFWVMWLITVIAFRVFEDPTSITAAAAAAFGSVTALLSVVIGLYQWTRAKEDK